MPGTNLTRVEAAARGELLRIESYQVELDLSGSGEHFPSTTTIRFTATTPGAASFADLVAPRIRELTLNGRPLDPATVFVDGRIELPDLLADNELRVVADCAYMNTGEGLHRTVDPADKNTYLYTHFEIPEARRVFTTFEQPDLKASFAFTVTAPADWTVLSCSPTPDPEPAPGGMAIWRFAPTPRISTYLTAVAAGRYHLVQDSFTAASGQVVPLGVACRASLAPFLDPDDILEVTRQGFGYYLATFDQPYPFAKYDQIFVPEYNLGAMENVGLVTISEEYLFRSKVTDAAYQGRAETILHELAHMWFGDLVTMRWWDDLWLKESFATYVSLRCQAEVTRWPHAWTVFANADKAWGMRQDQMPSTHPVVAEITDLDDVQLNFDGITYAKGAAVLKQLVAWVGADAFFAGMRTYFRRYAWGTTTLAELLAVLEQESGRDLGAWSRDWLCTAGPNTLRPEYTVDSDGRFTSFAVLQEAPAAHPTLRSHRIAIGLYGRAASAGPTGSDELVRRHRVELDIAGPRTEVPELIGQPRLDLVLLNDDDLTYAAVRLDPHSLSTVVSSVGGIADPLARALCWFAAWDMVRHAELPGREYLQLVLRGIVGETDQGVVGTLHRQLLSTVDMFVDPDHRGEALARLTDAARQELDAAPPGGDRQLAWAWLFGRTAHRPADLVFIADLLAGTAEVPGLVVDTELRWVLFGALARAGRADDDAIEAELDRDRTTAGEQYAAGARAARPDPADKAWAWAAVIDDDQVPNRTQVSMIGGPASPIGVGFMQAGQPELIAPYLDRYFGMLGAVWRDRTLEIASNIVVGLYPRVFASPEIVARTDAYLAGGTAPPALRRLLLEGRDDAERALAGRARDRAGTAVRVGSADNRDTAGGRS
jgi:aminopeptidase N